MCIDGWKSKGRGWYSPTSVDFGEGSEDSAPPRRGYRAEWATGHADPLEREAKFEQGIMRPMRVDTALKNSSTFEAFRKNRPFNFLPLYSGSRDPLGEAIKFEAAKEQTGDGGVEPGLQERPHARPVQPRKFQHHDGRCRTR